MNITGTITLAAATLLASHANAASVEIRDAVLRVIVVPEARSDIKVEVLKANPKLPITVRTSGGRVIVDGGLAHRIRSCRGSGQDVSVSVWGSGSYGYADMPQIVIHTPRTTSLSADGAVYGAVGKSDGLDLGNAGCGSWLVADVARQLSIHLAGSGDVRAGTSGALTVKLAGSGDVATRAVNGPVKVMIGGSGNANIASVQGPLDIDIAGSGDVRVGGGQSSRADVSVAGSGNVDFRGTAAMLNARIAGSGDVAIKAVTGAVNKAIVGSGSVTIG